MQPCLGEYGQLSLAWTPLGLALCDRHIESRLKGVKKGRDQL